MLENYMVKSFTVFELFRKINESTKSTPQIRVKYTFTYSKQSVSFFLNLPP